MRPLFLDQPNIRTARLAQSRAEYASPLEHPPSQTDRRIALIFWVTVLLATACVSVLAVLDKLPKGGAL